MLAACLVGSQACLWALLSLRASSSMHGEALRRVLRARLSFLLATERGRVLTRFSRDLDALDAALPGMLAQTLTCAAALSAALMAIIASSPLVTPAVLVLALLFGRVVRQYRPAAAEAKRLVAVLHGPVVSHLLESAGGREHIRSLGQVEETCSHCLALLEASTRAQVLSIGLQRWLALQLELLGAGLLLCVALFTVIVHGATASAPPACAESVAVLTA